MSITSEAVTIKPSSTSVLTKRILPSCKTRSDGNISVINRITYGQGLCGLGFLASVALPVYRFFTGDSDRSFFSKLLGYVGYGFLAVLNLAGIGIFKSPKDPLAADIFSTAAKHLAKKFHDNISTNTSVSQIFKKDFREKVFSSLNKIIYAVCCEMGVVNEDKERTALEFQDQESITIYEKFLEDVVKLRDKVACEDEPPTDSLAEFQKITNRYGAPCFYWYLIQNSGYFQKVFSGLFPDPEGKDGTIHQGLSELHQSFNSVLEPNGITFKLTYDKNKNKFNVSFLTTDKFTHRSTEKEYKPFIVLSFVPQALPVVVEKLTRSLSKLEGLQGQNEALNKGMFSVLQEFVNNFSADDTFFGKIFSVFSIGRLSSGYLFLGKNGEKDRIIKADSSSVLAGLSLKEVRELSKSDEDADLSVALGTASGKVDAGEVEEQRGGAQEGAGKDKAKPVSPPANSTSGEAGILPMPVATKEAPVRTEGEGVTTSLNEIAKELGFSLSLKDDNEITILKSVLVRAWLVVNKPKNAKSVREELYKLVGSLSKEIDKVRIRTIDDRVQIDDSHVRPLLLQKIVRDKQYQSAILDLFSNDQRNSLQRGFT